MKIAIMQPYFFPYIGYFQLISHVDRFIIYDNIQYTKKGWINRNRILSNGKDELISLPLRKDSDYLDINKRFISNDWIKSKTKLLSKIKNSYIKAPHFQEVYPLIKSCIDYDSDNLFFFIENSIKVICNHLDIKTEIIRSSEINHDFSLKAGERVIDICNSLNAKEYVNPIGGLELYDKTHFKSFGIDLSFLKAKNIKYQQFENEFIPYLSIVDLLFFLPKQEIINIIKTEYEIQ